MQGKKWDSAHPAIYPTGKLPQKGMVGIEKNVYNLVVRRFLAVFDEPAKRQTVKVTVDVEGEKFVLGGSRTLDAGWLHVYDPFVHLKDALFPQIAEGEAARIQRITTEEKFTKPPSRYNPASVLRKMEQGNIGTKATRATTLQTLYDRKYIREEKIVVTDLGFEVTDVLRKYCPSVVSVDFTRQLEEKMGLVQEGKETKAQILQHAAEILKLVLASLKENEKAVGEQLSRAVSQANLEEKIIGPCPTCQGGKLIIQHSKKTGKRFVGCTNYFIGTCKTAYPLPQRGYVKPSGKTCRSCRLPTVTVWFRNKRSWNLCFNSACSSKKPVEGTIGTAKSPAEKP
jgi:DNA topoisomerase-1